MLSLYEFYAKIPQKMLTQIYKVAPVPKHHAVVVSGQRHYESKKQSHSTPLEARGGEEV
jgi:hypothetical protein